MASYLKLDLSDITNILKLYGVEDIQSFDPISQGTTNSNYFVKTTHGQYCLRISGNRNLNEIKDELTILKFLKEKKFPYVAYPLPCTKGHYLFSYENNYGILLPWIEKNSGPAKSRKETCYFQGLALSKLHLIKVNNEVRPYEKVGRGFHKILQASERMNYPDDLKNFLARRSTNLFKIKHLFKEKGLIHGDFYWDNLLFDKNDHFYMIDFEQCGIGSLNLDIAISITGSCFKDNKIDLTLFSSFLEGYQQHRHIKLNSYEWANLLIMGLLSICIWRIERFTIGKIDDTKKLFYQELLNKAKNIDEKDFRSI